MPELNIDLSAFPTAIEDTPIYDFAQGLHTADFIPSEIINTLAMITRNSQLRVEEIPHPKHDVVDFTEGNETWTFADTYEVVCRETPWEVSVPAITVPALKRFYEERAIDSSVFPFRVLVAMNRAIRTDAPNEDELAVMDNPFEGPAVPLTRFYHQAFRLRKGRLDHSSLTEDDIEKVSLFARSTDPMRPYWRAFLLDTEPPSEEEHPLP